MIIFHPILAKSYLLFKNSVTAGSILAMLTVCTDISAGVPSKSDSTPVALNQNEERSWTLGFPLWIPGYRGQFAVGGIVVEGESDGDTVFDRIFSSEYALDFYLVGLINYQWQRWKFHMDLFSGTIGKSAKFNLNDKSVVDAKLHMLMPRIYTSYDILYNSSPVGPINRWQVYMGGRMYVLNLEVFLPGNREKAEGSKTWFTFLIGTELSLKIVNRLYLIMAGDIGGFIVSNKPTLYG